MREIRVRSARERREEWREQMAVEGEEDWRGFEEGSGGITPPWTVVSGGRSGGLICGGGVIKVFFFFFLGVRI